LDFFTDPDGRGSDWLLRRARQQAVAENGFKSDTLAVHAALLSVPPHAMLNPDVFAPA
jgi:hypothetical protein